MIKLIMTDVDGTISFEGRELDLKGVEALRRAESSGIPVGLATGNILPFAEAASVLIGVSGPIIAEDGGVIFYQATGRKEVLGARAEADRGLAALEREFGPLKQTRNSPDRLTGLTLEREVALEDVRKALKRKGFDLVAVDSGFAIHIKSPEVNKGGALRRLAEMMGVPLDNIAAIGDGQNDVEMLQAAGVSFAVANASDEVKKSGKFVTKGYHGEGVAEAVERILSSFR
ncbi:MAG: phosphoglycolate phosphatase [Candidatus Hadarchaeota archaeon]